MKYWLLGVSALALAIVLMTNGRAADVPSDAQLMERAKQIHTRIITFDSHLDLPFDYPGASEDGKTQFDLPKAARGQLKGAAIAVFVPQGPRMAEGYSKARADADKNIAVSFQLFS
jgi:membrane dipeptidase